MGEWTEISWAHHSMNFWAGCDRISPECANCYISRIPFFNASRPSHGGGLYKLPAQWSKPLKWQREIDDMRLLNGDVCLRIFSCSISDFFHAGADEWRPEAWNIIRDTPNLVWGILTKRPERILDCLPADWNDGYKNVWLGVSTGCKKTLDKMDVLRKVPCSLRFVSCEPLLEDISEDINLDGFGWVVTGGESGERHRPMDIVWAARLRDKVKAENKPFIFKQVSNLYPGTGRNALGRQWHEYPDPPEGMVWQAD
jgi:protein gp37